jgi:hypothetical protein
MSGWALSHLQLSADSDDGFAGSGFSLSLGGKELLSGKCIWSSSAAYIEKYLGAGNHVWYEKGIVDCDWSSWHLVDITVNLSESKTSIGVDGVELCSGPFEHVYGSNLIFKIWGYSLRRDHIPIYSLVDASLRHGRTVTVFTTPLKSRINVPGLGVGKEKLITECVPHG